MGALPIEVFHDVERYQARIEKAAREVRSVPTAAGVKRIYLPGEREHLAKTAARRDGIPLGGGTVEDLRATGRGLGIDFDEFTRT